MCGIINKKCSQGLGAWTGESGVVGWGGVGGRGQVCLSCLSFLFRQLQPLCSSGVDILSSQFAHMHY